MCLMLFLKGIDLSNVDEAAGKLIIDSRVRVIL